MNDVVAAVRASQSVLLSLHRQPDGDSIGSTIAVGLALRRRGKRVAMVTPDPVPSTYDFLAGVDEFRGWEAVDGQKFDLALLLDCADEERTGAPKPLGAYAENVVNVDHHLSNRRYGDICFIEPDAAACGELAARLIGEIGVTIDRDMATALYVAIQTDTGGFRYSSTSPHTHRLVARLLDAGIDPGEVSEMLYERQSPASLRLLALVLQSLVVREDLSVAYMVVRSQDFEKAGATPDDAESLGLVNYTRGIEGIEVGALLREEGDEVRLSLRSKGAVDVSAIASRLGGGGHQRAAGATVAGTLKQVTARLLDLLS